MIALSGDEIRMSDNALYLAHYVRHGAIIWGTLERNRERAEALLKEHEKFDTLTLGLYAKRVGEDRRSEIDELMQRDEWLTAQEALDWGFIDSIYEPGEDDEATAASVAALAYAPSSAQLQALGLPALPSPRALNARETPPSTKPKSQPIPGPMSQVPATPPKAPSTPAPEAAAQPPEVPATPATPASPDAATLARLERLETENQRLQQERLGAQASALKTALSGKLPATAVEALCEAAQVADTALQAQDTATLTFELPVATTQHQTVKGSLTERMTAIAALMPSMVKPHRLDTSTSAEDAETSKLMAKATIKM